MNFSQIFGVFSKRSEASDRAVRPLTSEFKSRVLLLCNTTFSDYIHRPNYPTIREFWEDIHTKLQYLHGRPTLTGKRVASVAEDAINFLLQCSDEHFLDFVEMIFQIHGVAGDSALVNSINTFFDVDSLPYRLTDHVYSPVKRIPASEMGLPSGNSDGGIRASTLELYPQVICLESEVLHVNAIEPTLTLLSGPAFSQANAEFREALKDYRKGDYRDCVTKCGSSFESVMKVICDRKKWPYQQTDTVSKLLKTILQQSTLDSFYEQPIMLIATIRNRYSTAHGAGTQQKTVSKHVANYVINATASAILLLVDETNP